MNHSKQNCLLHVNSKYYTIIYVIIVILICIGCDHSLENAIEHSDNNKTEILKVLDHYKKEKNSLKYEAAQFLIKNMLYNYCNDGAAIDEFDSLYQTTFNISNNNRTKYLNEGLEKIDFSNCNTIIDINNIKADYLINMIDYACDTWEKSSWSKNYDKSIFFNYVLPYRLSEEKISYWHQTIDSEFPLLKKDIVVTRRGRQYEAEDAHLHGCNIINADGASKTKAILLTNKKSKVTFNIQSNRDTRKRLIIKYTSISKEICATIKVNGLIQDTIYLSPTRNIETYGEKWFNKELPIKKGKNTISICSLKDTLGIDYIQLGPIERYTQDFLRDFSTGFYRISNKKTHHYITFDTVSAFINKPVKLLPLSSTDSLQYVRLDYQGYPMWKICSYKQDSIDLCLEIKFGTAGTLSPDSLITQNAFDNRPFQHWVFFPLGNDYYRIMNKHSGMFLEAKIDKRSGKEQLVQNPYSNTDSQRWHLSKIDYQKQINCSYIIGSAVSEALKIYDIAHQFEFFTYDEDLTPKASSIIKNKLGKCNDEANFMVYLCRHLGIPSTIDFTPHWGNRSNGHSWSVILNPDGKSTTFYMGNVPGDTANYFHPYKKPKVFRKQFQLNKEISKDFIHEHEIPSLFQYAKFTDVTDEYYATTDVEINVPKKYNKRKIAYICVFDNHEWVPVFYGKINNGDVKFKSMGRGIVYIAAIFKDNTIQPFGNPFLINNNGIIKEIKANPKKLQTMIITRKYPFMGAQDYFNSRMNGGQFQASNDLSFSKYSLLHTHHGITNGNWYEIPIKDKKTYKYVRYFGAKGSFCNINELEIYDKNQNKIEGKIIGTEGEPSTPKERVFDGDILTGFGAYSPDGNWVGLEFATPISFSKIRYIGRNDGNCIEIGDHYVLYYWGNNQWICLGEKTAEKNKLLFEKVPSEGLYIIKDVTKGVEERIFTYKNGKQIWW